MDPNIKKNLENKACKTGGGRRHKKKKHKPLKKGFLLNKKNGLGDEFRKKQKQQQKIDSCTKKKDISTWLDPNEVLTEDDLIDISKMDFDVTKNCTEECINDPNCQAKRNLRMQYRKEFANAEYHNNKVKLQNRLFKTKAEERRIKNDIRIYNECRDQMGYTIKDDIARQMKEKGIDPKTVTKEEIDSLVQDIMKNNSIT